MSVAERARGLLRDEMLRRLLGGGAVALVIKVSAAGLSFLMFLLLARAMTPEDFGVFGFGFSLAVTLSVVGSFGRRILVLRYIPAYASDGDEARLTGVVRESYALVTAGCATLGLLVAAAAALLPGVENRAALAAAGLLVLAVGLAELQASVMRAVAGIGLALAPRDIVWRLSVGLICLVLGAASIGPLSAATWQLVVAAVLLAIVLAQGLMHPRTRPQALLLDRARRERSEWRRVSLGLWGSSVVTALGTGAGVLVVGTTLSSVETGAFFAALRLAMLLDLLVVAAHMIAAPLVSRLWHQGERARVQRVYALVAAAATPAAALFLSAYALFGDDVLALFAPEYTSAWPVLLLLALGYFAKAAAGPAPLLLQFGGHERTHMWIVTATTLATLGLLLVLTPLFGAIGAGLATAVGMIATAAATARVAYMRSSVDPTIGVFVRRMSRGAAQAR